VSHKELPIFVRWYKFLGWLLDTTEKFPKRVRFTFSSRLDNLALDILEKITEAAYSKDKVNILKRINLEIEKMRVLLRLCHDKQYLSSRGYEHAAKELYEIGNMVGGWIKERGGKTE
jgi:four helix bundle protein